MKAALARVLLTGAGGGIGQPAARALLQAGAAVLLSGRSPARLAALARDLATTPGLRSGAVSWHAADLSEPGAAATLAAAAEGWDCNAVVHAAGLPQFGRLQDAAPQDIGTVLQTNLLAPMLLTQALLPHLLRQPQASVLCVGSALGAIGLPGYTVYGASKFGLRGFAQALGRELRGSSVRVQYLGPRSTRTAFNDADVEAYHRATGAAMDAPQRVAQALVALLQSDASERFVGWPEQLAVRLNGAAPGWLDAAFGRHAACVQDQARARAGRVGSHAADAAPARIHQPT